MNFKAGNIQFSGNYLDFLVNRNGRSSTSLTALVKKLASLYEQISKKSSLDYDPIKEMAGYFIYTLSSERSLVGIHCHVKPTNYEIKMIFSNTAEAERYFSKLKHKYTKSSD